MLQTAVAVGDVGGHPASGVGNFKGHRNCQMSDATVVTRNWSSCYLHVVDGMAPPCHRLAIYSGSFRQQMTVVEIIIANCIVCPTAGTVLACVFVSLLLWMRSVSASNACLRWTCLCMISYSDSLGPSAPLSRYVISMANAVLQDLTHVTSD